MKDIACEADIRTLVDKFYEKAGSDPLLSPIFLRLRRPTAHRQALYTYWTNVLLGDSSFDSQDFPRHITLMFSRRHFIRWLNLFLETIDSHFAGVTAEKAKVMVIKKSEEFQSKLNLSRF